MSTKRVKRNLVQVAFRLDKNLVKRLRKASWRDDVFGLRGPSQAQIVAEGIQRVLLELERDNR